ncbi:MAG: penicillin-binding transpeptidase domain-containing protein, partial [Brevinematia bacterium]
NLFTKLSEILEAIKVEMYFPKSEILESYMNHVYLGNNLYGFKKASKVYFNKDLRDLTIPEMAFLIKIITLPSGVYFKKDIIQSRARKLLEIAFKEKIITEDEYEAGMLYNVVLEPVRLPFSAPHFCFFVLEKAKSLGLGECEEIHTTIDIKLYYEVLGIVRNVLNNLRGHNIGDAGVLIVDNSNGEILCMVGSRDYFSEYGANNGVLIKRQPGSTMKPFTYALAIEEGIISLSSILPDIPASFPSRYGRYIPKNYNRRYSGPVRVAEALGNSLNIPAVYVLDKVGLGKYVSFLKSLEFTSITKPPSFYGLGLTLGNADVSLYELVRAYTIFPNNGVLKELKSIRYVKLRDGRKVWVREGSDKCIISKETAFLINHALSEQRYRVKSFGVNSPINFPFRMAVKTGTSKDYRDNTIIAYNKRYTIGIWAGNFGGESMFDLPSARGAGAIMKHVVLYMYNAGMIKNDEFDKPSNVKLVEVCSVSGDKPTHFCSKRILEYFVEGKEPRKSCVWCQDGILRIPPEYKVWAVENLPRGKFLLSEDEFKILYPENNSVFAIDSTVTRKIQSIILEASVMNDDVEWFANGEFVGRGNRVLFNLKGGEFKITAKHKGKTDSVRIVVVER